MHIVILIALAFLAGILVHWQLTRVRQAKSTGAARLSSPYEANVAAADFDSMVLQTSKDTPVLVDFYATWCPPCQHLAPVLTATANHYQGKFLLAKVDVDAQPALSEKYGIKAMPTVVLFRDGRSVARFEGARQERSVRFFLAQNGVLPPEEQTRGAAER